MNSYWLEKSTIKSFKELDHDIKADVCIIGGGLSGITTAYYLANSGLKVVIIERNKIGNGTSGHTTAKITSQHDLFYSYLINSYSKNFAKTYLELNEQAISNIENIINSENIDCDFERQSAYIFTNDQNYVMQIQNEYNALKELGFHTNFSISSELPLNVKGLLEFPNQAAFNPTKYIAGIIDTLCKNENLDIYENTSALIIKKNSNSNYDVITDKNNAINAKHIVLASHYPIKDMPGFHFIKMYQETSYLVGMEVPYRLLNGMYINCETPNISLRIAKDNDKYLLIVGGSNHKTGKNDNIEDSYNFLESIAKQICPEGIIKYRWNSEDCISLDKIPYIGIFSHFMPNVYLATGYKKWGMTFSNIASKIISDSILGDKKYLDTFNPLRFKPIKNHKELTNMFSQSMHSILLDKFKVPKDIVNSVQNDKGKVIKLNNKLVGIYKDNTGKVYAINPICSHLHCLLSFNNLDKTWDCPCHGSRFTYDGKVIYSPASYNLDKIDLN